MHDESHRRAFAQLMRESDGSASNRGPFNENHLTRYIVVEPVGGTKIMSAVYDKAPARALVHWIAVSEEEAARKMALLDLHWPEKQIASLIEDCVAILGAAETDKASESPEKKQRLLAGESNEVRG